MSDKAELVKSDTEISEKRSQVSTVGPLVDIYENENEILLHTEMPGVEKENIKVNIDNGKLTLSAVRKVAKKSGTIW